MMDKVSGKVIIGVMAAILAVIIFLLWHTPESLENGHVAEPRACTMEAFICPDGTAVGREGERCEFRACPNAESFTGELMRDSGGYKLSVAAPEGLPGASFALPIQVENAAIAESFVGDLVTLRGDFISGATLAVREMTGADPAIYGEEGREITAHVGETVFLRGLKIKLLHVTGDSRCPADVECIWAGNVKAEVELTSDTDHETTTLTSGDKSHSFDTYHVYIARALPDPRAGITIPQDDYLVTFRVVTMR